MKKRISLMFTGLSLMIMMGVPLKADAGWGYKSAVSLDKMGNTI